MSRPKMPNYRERAFAPWRDKAECEKQIETAPVLANAWHTPTEPTRAHAELICETVCKVREECLRDALTDPYATGLHGGFNFEEGKVDRKDVRPIRRYLAAEDAADAHKIHIRVKKKRRVPQAADLEEAV